MKKNFRSFLVLLLVTCLNTTFSFSQATDSPVAYMNFIGEQYKEIQKDMLSYTSAVAHGKSAKKVEIKRKEMLQTNKDARKKIAAMAPFKGDKSLRDSAVKFLDMSYHVLNDDYGKIVNMEEVAEQSYDDMEAYLLAQDLANEKLDKAGELLNEGEKKFAADHNVNLIEGSTDEVGQKMKIAAEVNNYHRTVYLIFFKSYKQEMYLMDAIAKKDVNAIEQNKNSLLKFTQEGLTKLNEVKPYKGDNSLMLACKQSLDFYKKEYEKIPVVTNYLIKEENFMKVKKAYDAKKESDRKQADVDQYNKAVNEMNASVNEYNTLNNQLNQERAKTIDNYNKKSSAFLDKHTPKYK